jgi:hypothetical protein
MCISSVHERNRSVLHLNDETEVCVKQKYKITHNYFVHKSMSILEYGVYSETQVVTVDIFDISFYNII